MRWLVDGNELLLKLDDDKITRLSAMDIWKNENDSLPVFPSIKDIGLFVSNMTAMPEVKIIPSPTSDFGKLQLYVRDDLFNEVGLKDGHLSDHVVIGNEWIPFTPELLPALINKLDDADVEIGRDLTLIEYLRCIRDFNGEEWFEDKLIVNARTLSDTALSLPSEVTTPLFTGNLYDYQRKGSNWLVEVMSQGAGAVLGDTMGLGKTIQVIKVMCVLLNRKPDARILIVCPSSLVENWTREIAKFSEGIEVIQHIGSERTGDYRRLTESVVITTYDVARIDSPVLAQITWDLMVLDEAQFIKNPSAQRTKRIKEIPRHIGLAVTGTPFENHVSDIWSIFDFCLPGFLGTRGSFESRFKDDEYSASVLGEMISPLLLRRRLEDVPNDLPDMIKIPMPIKLSMREAEAYEFKKEHYMNSVGALGAIGNLRKDLARPGWDQDCITTQKYDYLQMVLQELTLTGEKMIVFTDQFIAIGEIVRWCSMELGVPTFELHGKVPATQRQEIVDNFSNVVGSAVLVCNPKVGGTGLNIVEASHVFHFSMQWNPAVIDQATARSYRRGQKKNVVVYYPYYVSTIEEYMWDRVANKRVLADRAVQVNEGETINKNELIAALSLNPTKR